MGEYGKDLGKRRQGSLRHVKSEPRFKYQGLGFDGRNEKDTEIKITILKEKYKI